MSDLGRDGSLAAPLDGGLKVRLSIMMFLQYAIWGAWLPLLWDLLTQAKDFNGTQVGNIFAVGAVGAIFGPFIAGQVADRWFNTEKFLAFSHILGGVLAWQMASLDDYNTFFWYALIYGLIYSPTLALTNSLSFHHIPDRDRDFGKIRLWGTIGWIVAGIGIGQWLLHNYAGGSSDHAKDPEVYAGMADAFKLSGICGIAMGIFCLFGLPKTVPARVEHGHNATMKAVGEISAHANHTRLLMLFVIAVPVSCIHQFYFVHTAPFLNTFQGELGGSGLATSLNSVFGIGGGGLMTLGQMSEIFVLAMIPVLAMTLSRKKLLMIGLLAYAARMALFSYAPMLGDLGMPLVILGVALHGFCFGCFIFVAYMVVDEECSTDVRASAQNLFNLVIIGIGIIVGSKVASSVSEWAATRVSDGDPWYAKTTEMFQIPMIASLACLILMALFYPAMGKKESSS
ncbi:MAG: MFS transporter [Planctomycetota bacterium]|nr:MFS transporter [Planctomycetota bacterium]